jgi:hypothetical protein
LKRCTSTVILRNVQYRIIISSSTHVYIILKLTILKLPRIRACR